MKYYAQYTREGREVCGSDGVFVLDGRMSIDSMVHSAQVHQQWLYSVQPHYDGFKIMQGNRFSNSRCIRTVEFKADGPLPLNHIPSTPMSQEEMQKQCAVVSQCPEISEDEEYQVLRDNQETKDLKAGYSEGM